MNDFVRARNGLKKDKGATRQGGCNAIELFKNKPEFATERALTQIPFDFDANANQGRIQNASGRPHHP